MHQQLRIISDSREISRVTPLLSKRQHQKLKSFRDAVLAQRADGTYIVYRPQQSH